MYIVYKRMSLKDSKLEDYECITNSGFNASAIR